MTYARSTDLELRYGSDEINRLSGDDDQATMRLDAALGDATAEINAVLAGSFTLPLTPLVESAESRALEGQSRPVWPLLVTIACDLTRARLYDDAMPEAVEIAARRARRRLGELATGRTALLNDRGIPATRYQIDPAVSGPPAVMDTRTEILT